MRRAATLAGNFTLLLGVHRRESSAAALAFLRHSAFLLIAHHLEARSRSCAHLRQFGIDRSATHSRRQLTKQAACDARTPEPPRQAIMALARWHGQESAW